MKADVFHKMSIIYLMTALLFWTELRGKEAVQDKKNIRGVKRGHMWKERRGVLYHLCSLGTALHHHDVHTHCIICWSCGSGVKKCMQTVNIETL